MISFLVALAMQGHTSIGPADLDCQPLTSYPHVRTYPPAKGRTWITLYAGQTPPPPGVYALASKSLMPNPDGMAVSPWGELVTIQTWVTTSTGTTKGFLPHGDSLQTRWDGKAGILATVPITKDVRLSNGSGTLHLAFVDGAEIENWSVPAGWTLPRAISIQFSRNIFLRMSRIGASSDTSPGRGYGIQSQRSVGTHVSGLTADGVRHAFTLFGGTAFVGGLKATNPKGTQLDTHGFGGQLWATEIDGGGSDIAIGNKYPLGDEAELWMVKNAKVLWLHGRSSARVYYSKFDGPLGIMRNQYGEPLSFYGYRSTFTAFSTTQPVHYEGPGPFAIVPSLEECVLVPFMAPPPGCSDCQGFHPTRAEAIAANPCHSATPSASTGCPTNDPCE